MISALQVLLGVAAVICALAVLVFAATFFFSGSKMVIKFGTLDIGVPDEKTDWEPMGDHE